MAELDGVGSLNKFHEAFENSMPGDKIVYHVGRNLGGPSSTHAYYLYEQGMVELVQIRAALQGYFKYVAIRTKKHRDGSMKPVKGYKRPRQV